MDPSIKRKGGNKGPIQKLKKTRVKKKRKKLKEEAPRKKKKIGGPSRSNIP